MYGLPGRSAHTNGKAGPQSSQLLEPSGTVLAVLARCRDSNDFHTLADAEGIVATLPTTLGHPFNHLHGVAQMRQLVSQFVSQREAGAYGAACSGSAPLSNVASGPEWEQVLQSSREMVSGLPAKLLPHPVAAPEGEANTNVMCFDIDSDQHGGDFFHELGGAQGFTMDELDDLLGGEDHTQALEREHNASHLDPSESLLASMEAFAAFQRARLPRERAARLDLDSSGSSRPFGLAECEHGSEALDSWPHADALSASQFLSFFDRFMDVHPEVVWQCPGWRLLVQLMVSCVPEEPAQTLAVTKRYFPGAGPRQRYLLVLDLVATVASRECPVSDDARRTLVTDTMLFVGELPADWVVLLDTELEVLLADLLCNVLVPHGDLLSLLDPHASWLVSWCDRPSLGDVVRRLPREAPAVLEQLSRLLHHVSGRGASLPDVHLLCVSAYLLPHLLGSSGECDEPGAVRLAEHFLACLSSHKLADEVITMVGDRLTNAAACCAGQLPLPLVDDAVRSCAGSLGLCERGGDAHRSIWHLQTLQTILVARKDRLPSASPQLLAEGSAVIAQHLVTSLQCAVRLRQSASVDAARVASGFFALLLPRYGCECLPFVLKVVVIALGGDAFAAELLVHASTDLLLWLEIAEKLGSSDSQLDYQTILSAIFRTARADESAGTVSDPEKLPAELTSQATLLLMRWGTLPVANVGLRQAIATRLGAIREPLFFEHRAVAAHPLFLPSELRGGPEGDGMVAMELPAAAQRELAEACLCQSALLLLGVAEMPDRLDHRDRSYVERLLAQVDAACLSDNGESAPDSPAGDVHLGDESLLTLLSTAALCLLVSVGAEEWLWRSPPDSRRRLERLRGMCVGRRGVDPVYFVVRFLTSGGKGRRRLRPILLGGFGAELQIETTIPVDEFLDGEEYPRQSAAAAGDGTNATGKPAPARAGASELVVKAFGHLAVSAAARAEFVAGPCLALVRLAHPGSTSDLLVSLLRRQPLEAWLFFGDTQRCASAVARMAARPAGDEAAALHGILNASGIDLHFVATVCVGAWLRSPPLLEVDAATPSGGLLRASLKEFMKRGPMPWVELASTSLVQHVLAAAREYPAMQAQGSPNGGSPPLTVPSALFVDVLSRPFALIKRDRKSTAAS